MNYVLPLLSERINFAQLSPPFWKNLSKITVILFILFFQLSYAQPCKASLPLHFQSQVDTFPYTKVTSSLTIDNNTRIYSLAYLDSAENWEDLIQLKEPQMINGFEEIPPISVDSYCLIKSVVGGLSENPIPFTSSYSSILEVPGDALFTKAIRTAIITAAEARNNKFEAAPPISIPVDIKLITSIGPSLPIFTTLYPNLTQEGKFAIARRHRKIDQMTIFSVNGIILKQDRPPGRTLQFHYDSLSPVGLYMA